MRKALAYFITLLLCLPCAAPAEAPLEQPDYTSRSRVTMDYFSTASMLQVFDDFSDPVRAAAFEETWEEIKNLLGQIDAALSLSSPESDVSRFNALQPGEELRVSPETAEILRTVGEAWSLTEGAYDPTVAGLVDLFGFTPRFGRRDYRPLYVYDRPAAGGVLPLPDPSDIAALAALVDFGGIQAEDGAVVKTAPPAAIRGVSVPQSLDLGGIGKGYAVDRVMTLLREKGYRYGYFSCGNSSIGILSRAVASRGAPGPAQWGVGVQYPRYAEGQETLVRIFTRDRSLSTSGDYEHSYILNGVRYCHLIDPASGWPVNMPADGVQSGICSVTVLGENAAMCDALSTALCVMGPGDAMEFMNRPEMRDYQYLMILYSDRLDYCEIVTDLKEDQYEILDPQRFCLANRLDEDGNVLYTGAVADNAEGD